MTAPRDWGRPHAPFKRTDRYGPCKCSDPGCAKKHGNECPSKGVVLVYRNDMNPYGADEKFRMCHTCADDAVSSGVFHR